MIRVCDLCHKECGVTHGDQLWEYWTCDECSESEGI